MRNLNGKVIAITGGARGIGEATAKALAAAGARVAVGDLDADLAATSAQAYGGIGLPLDVTSEESFAGFLDKVEAEYGRIDGLVNNAGIMVIGRHLEAPLDAQLKQIDINLRGVAIGCHAVAPRLVAAGGGQIVNVASLAGRFAAPGCALYSGTKAGVLAFTEALDAELSPQKVRVAAVLPSFTNTGLISGTTAPRLSPAIEPEQVAAAVVKLLGKHRPTAVVPKFLAFSSASWPLYPNRLKRSMGKRTGMDTMFLEYDHAARAAYEERTTGE
ncbi:SDR family NAD(P)-dependent oxidoreductase [Nocardioides marmoriginsengisoli]|uniref:SDR family NAD(P)-dependent oxidoreductase n=1 Tax=Nocardioides marmoriginsengisoli TaxID=661483 RepID=A0A3N0CCD3_9ACTN|nr:SDR family NAD(P)-dependent oxidoreductase [Nocardioides marmoriginsengisoli]RNL61104.1 SDR family NAD(P)-dependent oxidoreductase [Nocardioides marmoriginsengisoli]